MTALSVLKGHVRERAVTYVSTRPTLYYGLRRMTGSLDPQCIRGDTDIVIEGYPRSANSTTVHRFLERQDRVLHVAHHKHHAAQLLQAVDWNIPAVVLIRPPRDACLSLLALGAEARHRSGRPEMRRVSFANVFYAYVAFYEAVERKLDGVVIARFETLKDDISELIDRVNARFDSAFQAQALAATPQPKLGWHAMPTETRNTLKQKLTEAFLAEHAASPALQRLSARADAVYARYEEADARTG